MHIVASANSQDDRKLAHIAGNANSFYLEGLFIQNNHHGVYVDGPDTNAGSIVNCHAKSNAGWGFWDTSSLGNTYIGCSTDINKLGSYKTDSDNAFNVFVGCYRENNQPAASVISPSVHVGGLSNTGVGNAPMLTNLIGMGTTESPNKTGVSRVQMTSGGSGYTSAPMVTFDPPTGYASATASSSIVNGKITQITITNPGAGYSEVPMVTITGDGTGVQGTATVEYGRVTAITVTGTSTDNAGGSGYGSATTTVTLEGPNSTRDDGPKVTTAIGTAYLNPQGEVAYVIMGERRGNRMTVTKGAGYPIGPTVSFTGGGGSGATGTAYLSAGGLIERVEMRNKGVGYTSAPTVSFTGGTGAKAKAVLMPAESIQVSGNKEDGTLFLFHRSDVNIKQPWRLKCLPNTGDILLDFANSSRSVPFRITGTQTDRTYGRKVPVPYVFEATKFSLGGKIQTEAAEMPTKGEYAQGDRVFNTAATEVGTQTGSKYIVLGWYRLTNGSNHEPNRDWVQMRCLTGN